MGLLYNCRVNTFRRVNATAPLTLYLTGLRAQYVAPSKDERVVRQYGAEVTSELKFDATADVKQGDSVQLIYLNGHPVLDAVNDLELFLVVRSANAIGLAQIHAHFKGWFQ